MSNREIERATALRTKSEPSQTENAKFVLSNDKLRRQFVPSDLNDLKETVSSAISERSAAIGRVVMLRSFATLATHPPPRKKKGNASGRSRQLSLRVSRRSSGRNRATQEAQSEQSFQQANPGRYIYWEAGKSISPIMIRLPSSE